MNHNKSVKDVKDEKKTENSLIHWCDTFYFKISNIRLAIWCFRFPVSFRTLTSSSYDSTVTFSITITQLPSHLPARNNYSASQRNAIWSIRKGRKETCPLCPVCSLRKTWTNRTRNLNITHLFCWKKEMFGVNLRISEKDLFILEFCFYLIKLNILQVCFVNNNWSSNLSRDNTNFNTFLHQKDKKSVYVSDCPPLSLDQKA